MKRNLTILLLIFVICSCADNSSKKQNEEKHFTGYHSKKSFGISIENGPRQGFQYFDNIGTEEGYRHITSTAERAARDRRIGTEYSYRYITTTIINDTILPIHLKISFSKEYNKLHSIDSLKSRVFLLPRQLTPERQHFDNSMSKELINFLDTGVVFPITLDTIINPNGRCVMSFGVLTDVKYSDFYQIGLTLNDNKLYVNKHDNIIQPIISTKKPVTLTFGLALDNSFIIPCGQLSFGD